MHGLDVFLKLAAKVVAIVLMGWLWGGVAVALDAPVTEKGPPAKSITLGAQSSKGVVPEAVPDIADADENGESAEIAPTALTKTTDQPSVLDIAGAPLKALGTVVDATRDAIRSYLAGDKAEAIKTLSYAADQGHVPAQWKLARMYAEGDGVPRDDLRAFENFSRMCDRHAEEAPNSPTAPFVSSAFIALGSYYLNGIPNSTITSNPERAREMFAYSASYFGDSEAQLLLARLYLDGVGGARDPKVALRWLNLSAEKGNRLAQAEFGRLLFSGQVGSRQRARGLMWLKLASERADPVEEVWILQANSEALLEASDSDRLAANAYLAQRRHRAIE
jgi:hypothetical protein